ncbi:hypothetical protein, partial [Vibrio marinisediminis]|uniref:hypothetical protein n=1 Tax=Vibrio marinisediminis TaxID=2758441 RepID=UPI001C70CAD0
CGCHRRSEKALQLSACRETGAAFVSPCLAPITPASAPESLTNKSTGKSLQKLHQTNFAGNISL